MYNQALQQQQSSQSWNQNQQSQQEDHDNDFGDFQTTQQLDQIRQVTPISQKYDIKDNDFEDFQQNPVVKQSKNDLYQAFDFPAHQLIQQPSILAHPIKNFEVQSSTLPQRNKMTAQELYKAFDSPVQVQRKTSEFSDNEFDDFQQPQVIQQQEPLSEVLPHQKEIIEYNYVHKDNTKFHELISQKQTPMEEIIILEITDQSTTQINQLIVRQDDDYGDFQTIESNNKIGVVITSYNKYDAFDSLGIVENKNNDSQLQDIKIKDILIDTIQNLEDDDEFEVYQDSKPIQGQFIDLNYNQILKDQSEHNQKQEDEDEFEEFQDTQAIQEQHSDTNQSKIQHDTYNQNLMDEFPVIERQDQQKEINETYQDFQDTYQTEEPSEWITDDQQLKQAIQLSLNIDYNKNELLDLLSPSNKMIEEKQNVINNIQYCQKVNRYGALIDDSHVQDQLVLQEIKSLHIESKQVSLSNLPDLLSLYQTQQYDLQDNLQAQVPEPIPQENQTLQTHLVQVSLSELPNLISLYNQSEQSEFNQKTDVQINQQFDSQFNEQTPFTPEIENQEVQQDDEMDDFDDFEEAQHSQIEKPVILNDNNVLDHNQYQNNINNLDNLQTNIQVKISETNQSLIQPIGSWRQDIDKVIGLEKDCLDDMIEELNQYGLNIYIPRVEDYKMLVEKIDNLRLNKQKALESEQYEILASIRDQLHQVEEKARILKDQIYNIRNIVDTFQSRNLEDNVNHYFTQSAQKTIVTNPFLSMQRNKLSLNREMQQKLKSEIKSIQNIFSSLLQGFKSDIKRVFHDEKFKQFLQGTQIILQLCQLCEVDTQKIEDTFEELEIQFISLTNDQAVILIEKLLVPEIKGEPSQIKRCSLLGTVILGPSMNVGGKDYNQYAYNFMKQ